MKTPEQIAMKLYTSGTIYSPIVADGDLMRDVMVAAINADRAQRPTAPNTHRPGCRPDSQHPGYWYCVPEGAPHTPSGPDFAALIAAVRETLVADHEGILSQPVIALLDALDPQTPKEK